MPTYFGEQSGATNSIFYASAPRFKGNNNIEFTCPGSGNQIVKELSSALYVASGSVPVRIGLYSNDLSTLICQGSSTYDVANTSVAWVGHMSQSEITPNPATLTGGVKYKLIMASNSTNIRGATSTGHTSGDFKLGNSDYTGGFPASISYDGSDSSIWFNIRCGVDPEISGVPLPVFMHHYMHN